MRKKKNENKKKRHNANSNTSNSKSSSQQQKDDKLSTLDDFTSKEIWDKFFTIRGADDSFEWYAEWTQLKTLLLSILKFGDSREDLSILVPGCGNSKISERLYEEGFISITNVDFSDVIISDMLRRNVWDRPFMRWRVMDITDMQFSDATFDVILDKGGLDALVEPESGPKLGNQYLSKVRGVLKPGGKFICLTLGQSHVLGLLFRMFRFGWEMNLQCVPQKSPNKDRVNTFMVVAVKGDSCSVGQIASSFDISMSCNSEQAHGISAALEVENKTRKTYVDDSDIVYSLEDLELGAKGDLNVLSPGRRVQVTLGGEGNSRFRYRAVVLDAQEQSLPFAYQYLVYLVPKTRGEEWLFFSEEGQWMAVRTSKAARLTMVLLDSRHAYASSLDIQKDLSPLVESLQPEKYGTCFLFLMSDDGIKLRNVIHQVTSKHTGTIIVEDVTYKNAAAVSHSKEPLFRRLVYESRLVFGRGGLVQSEALLIDESSELHGAEVEKMNSVSNLKSKKGDKQKADLSAINDMCDNKKVDHTFLASAYHTGIVTGFTLIQTYLDSVTSRGGKVETVVIGLGAGLLPMYLHKCMDMLHVEVVELDPAVVTLAKEYFGFSEDARLKVHVADGIPFLKNRALQVTDNDKPEKTANNVESTLPNGSSASQKLDIIIVDVDSSDSRSKISCPAADFLEDTFFTTVKDVLSDNGLFIINLVSRSPSMNKVIISRMKAVFSHLYTLQLEEDVNEVVFAVNSMTLAMENISEAATQLDKLLKFGNSEQSQNIVNNAMKIKRA